MSFTLGVVIPVYNRTAELHSALRSVLSQTRLPDEIVVVDDGSTEPVELDARLKSNSIVKLIRLQKNSGAAAARQRGLDTLATSHVAFLDSDDVWLPDKLWQQVTRLRELDYDDRVAVGCAWRFVMPGGLLGPNLLPRATGDLNDFVSGCWYCPGSTVVMSRRVLNEIGGFDTSLRRLEDFDLFVRFSRSGGRLEVLPMCGATIKRGKNATVQDVRGAAATILHKYQKSLSPSLTSETTRRLTAWLAVEQAVAAKNDRKFAAFLAFLVYSFALVPRRRVQLGNWLKVLPDP